MMPKAPAAPMVDGEPDRMEIKRQLLQELMQHMNGGVAQELKSKYAPAPEAPEADESGASGGTMDLTKEGSGGELDLTKPLAAGESGGTLDLAAEAAPAGEPDGDELAGLDEETLKKLLAELGTASAE